MDKRRMRALADSDDGTCQDLSAAVLQENLRVQVIQNREQYAHYCYCTFYNLNYPGTFIRPFIANVAHPARLNSFQNILYISNGIQRLLSISVNPPF